MNFKDILQQAQAGREAAIEELLTRYRPLLVKESVCNGVLSYSNASIISASERKGTGPV